jgi:tetratricopeptide (TPR) repeat protein
MHVTSRVVRVVAAATLTIGCTGGLAAQGAPAGLAKAVALFDAHRYGDARPLFEQLAAQASDGAPSIYLGRIAFDERDLDGAIQHFERGTQRDNASATAHLWLARAYRARGVVGDERGAALAKKAKDELDRAIALAPADVESRAELVQWYVATPPAGGGGENRARDEAKKLARINGYQGAYWTAWIDERVGHDEDADRGFRALIAAYPDSAQPRVRVTNALAKAKRWDEAFALVDERLQKAPDDGIFLYALGQLGAFTGRRPNDAERALRRYLERPIYAPLVSPAGAHYYLGVALEKQQKTDAAIREYEAAARIDSTLAGAQRALARLRDR